MKICPLLKIVFPPHTLILYIYMYSGIDTTIFGTSSTVEIAIEIERMGTKIIFFVNGRKHASNEHILNILSHCSIKCFFLAAILKSMKFLQLFMDHNSFTTTLSDLRNIKMESQIIEIN